MVYKANNVDTVIGTMRYLPGNGERQSSDLVVRFDRAVVKSIGSGDPCDGPPVDDMGEEEEVLKLEPRFL